VLNADFREPQGASRGFCRIQIPRLAPCGSRKSLCGSVLFEMEALSFHETLLLRWVRLFDQRAMIVAHNEHRKLADSVEVVGIER
jgi:hypothetical protein